MPPSRMAEWFQDRRWRVVTEADGRSEIDPIEADGRSEVNSIPVVFRRGKFTVGKPGAFRSPLSGNPGCEGVLLQEVDADGKDIPGSRQPFGVPAVKTAREDFHAIV